MPDPATVAQELVDLSTAPAPKLDQVEFALSRGLEATDLDQVPTVQLPARNTPGFWGKAWTELKLAESNSLTQAKINNISHAPYAKALDPYWDSVKRLTTIAERDALIAASDTRFRPTWADSFGYNAQQLWLTYGIAASSGIYALLPQSMRGSWYDMVDKKRQLESVYAASNVGTFQNITAGLAGSLADPLLPLGMWAGSLTMRLGSRAIAAQEIRGLAGAELEKAVATNIANAMRVGAATQGLGAALRVAEEGGEKGDNVLLTSVAAVSAAALTSWLGMWGGGEQAFGGSSLKQEAWQLVGEGLQGGGEELSRQLAVQQFDPMQVIEQSGLELLGGTVFSAPHLASALLSYRANVSAPLKVAQDVVREHESGKAILAQTAKLTTLREKPRILEDLLSKSGMVGEARVSQAEWDSYWQANGASAVAEAKKWNAVLDLTGTYHIPLTDYFANLSDRPDQDNLMKLTDLGSGKTPAQVSEDIKLIQARSQQYAADIRQVLVDQGKDKQAIMDTLAARMIKGGANKKSARLSAEVIAEAYFVLSERAKKSGVPLDPIDIFNGVGLQVTGAKDVQGPTGDETTRRKALAKLYADQAVTMYTVPGWVSESGKPMYTTLKDRAEGKAKELGGAVQEALFPADHPKLNTYRKEQAGIVIDAEMGSAPLNQSATGTLNIDGVERSTTNSNGKPIAQTEDGVRAFWKWFGDSKVVDEQGRPLVVYHGSRTSIDDRRAAANKQTEQNKITAAKAEQIPRIKELKARLESILESLNASGGYPPIQAKRVEKTPDIYTFKEKGGTNSDYFAAVKTEREARKASEDELLSKREAFVFPPDVVEQLNDFGVQDISAATKGRGSIYERRVNAAIGSLLNEIVKRERAQRNMTEPLQHDILVPTQTTDRGHMGVGIYFAMQREYAEKYGSTVYEAYLKANDIVDFDNIKLSAKQQEVYNREFSISSREGIFDGSEIRGMLLSRIASEQHPIHDARTMNRGTDLEEIAVLDPTQIKSATGNSGAFDPANPSILAQSTTTGPRGSYDPKTRAATFNKKSDASTPMHEGAHHMLDVWAAVAGSAPEASPLGVMATNFREWIAGNAADVRKKYLASLADEKVKAAAEAELADLTVLKNMTAKDMETRSDHVWAAAHEYFANGFEKFIATQKAPSKSMASVFRNFATMLAGLWRRMIGNNLVTPEVNLDDKAKAFMSAMIATDSAMKEIEIDNRYYELSQKAATISGVDPRDALALAKITEKESSAVAEDMVKKALATIEATSSKERQDYKKSIEADVIADAEANDAQTFAIATLLSDMQREGRTISEKAAIGARHDGLTDALRRRNILGKTGDDVGALALNHGFNSSKDLLIALAKSVPREEYIGNILEARADEKFPGIKTAEDLMQEAREYVLDNEHISLLAAEAVLIQRADALKLDAYKRAMAGKTESESLAESAQWMKEQEVNMQIVRAVEANNVSRLPPHLLKPGHWERIAADARARMLDAMEKGDFKSAESHHFTVRTAEIRAGIERKAKRHGEKLIDDIRDFAEDKKLRQGLEKGGMWVLLTPNGSQTFATQAEANDALKMAQGLTVAGQTPPALIRRSLTLDLVDSLLAKYSFAPFSQSLAKTIDLRAQARKSLDALEQVGRLTDVPQSVIDGLPVGHVNEIPLKDLDLLLGALKSAKSDHRLMNSASSASNTQQIDEDVASLAATADKVSQYEGKSDIVKRAYDIARMALSHNTRLSTLVHMIDGGDTGIMNTRILRPLRDGEAAAQILTSAGIEQIKKIVKARPPTDTTTEGDILTAGGFRTSREEARTLVAHWGSLDGRRYVAAHMMAKTNGMTEEQAMAAFPEVINQLTETDIKMVEWIWQNFENTRARTAEAKRRLGEGEPEWIQPVSFLYGRTVLTGGYAPVRYAEGSYSSLGEIADIFVAYQGTAKPNENHHKTRSGPQAGKALDLSHDTVIREYSHHAQTAMMLEPARNIAAFMAKAGPMIAEKWGVPIFRTLESNISFGIVGDRSRNDYWVKSANFVYRRASVAALALNAWTGIQQPLGLSNAIPRVGYKNMGNAIRAFATDYQNTKMFADTSSNIMRGRQGRFDHSMHDALSTGKFNSMEERLNKMFLWHIAKAQQQVDIIVWTAAYNNALAGVNPVPHLEAVKIADQVVLETQGSSMNTEVTPIQQNQYSRLLAIFATYPMTVFNEIRLAGIANGQPGPKRAAKIAWALLHNLTIPSILTYALAQMLKGGADESDDWETAVFKSQWSGIMAMSPLTRMTERIVTHGAENLDIPAARPLIAALKMSRGAYLKAKHEMGLGEDPPDSVMTFTNFSRAFAMAVPFPAVMANRLHDALNEYEIDDREFWFSSIFGENQPAK